MPSGRGARASASSSATERSSYRATVMRSSSRCRSASSDAAIEYVPLRILRRADVVVEVVEVPERLTHHVRIHQLADLVVIECVDRVLLLLKDRERAGKLLFQLAIAHELSRADIRHAVVGRWYRVARVHGAGEVEVVRDRQYAAVRRGEQLGVVQSVEREVEIADQVLEQVGERQILALEIR